jgi:hypothetical protein
MAYKLLNGRYNCSVSGIFAKRKSNKHLDALAALGAPWDRFRIRRRVL